MHSSTQRCAAALLIAAACGSAYAVGPADTAVTTITSKRSTFDGNIRNNSLALSPDESMAVVSYSERPAVVAYTLKTGAVQGVLRGYVTPRNIVFAPDGQSFYVSDSSLGNITRIDSVSLKTQATLAAGPGALPVLCESAPRQPGGHRHGWLGGGWWG